MPRKTTKKPSNESDGKEFFAAIRQIEQEKGIPAGYMMEKITQALASAYKRDHEGAGDNIEVKANPETGEVRMFILKDIVESVDNPATEISPNLINGTLDIAAVSTNLASTLYHRTEGGVQLLALNTLGVLYILENGDSVRSVSDLAGRTIYATGQASNPEYVLNHLLRQNGLEPGEDVDIQWRTSDEVTALMAAGEIDLCMLPVPAATAVQLQNDQVRAALDLTQLWDELDSGSVLTMGCVVVRTEFAQENPEAVAAFLEEYAASIDFVSSDPEAAAPMVARFGITASEEIALAAIPDCSLVCITGADMRDSIQGYYEVLAAADPASIGGAIPDDAFYYIP